MIDTMLLKMDGNYLMLEDFPVSSLSYLCLEFSVNFVCWVSSAAPVTGTHSSTKNWEADIKYFSADYYIT